MFGKVIFCLCAVAVTHREATGFCLPQVRCLPLQNIKDDTVFVSPEAAPKTPPSTSETKIHIP